MHLAVSVFTPYSYLPYQSYNAKQQRKHIIDIMSFVLTQFGRQGILIAETENMSVNPFYTGQPVAFVNLSIALQVVLATGEVPHKIPPVHEVHLITEEETQVLSESGAILSFRLTAIVIPHSSAFDISPVFICLHVARIAGVHTRKEHPELIHILVGCLVAGNDILVLLPFLIRGGSILSVSFLLHGYAHVALYAQFDGCIVGMTEEERTVAILLTVKIVLEREHIVGRVLIHRCIGIGAYDNSSVAAIAYQYHSEHNKSCIAPACHSSSSVFFRIVYPPV